MTKKSQTTTIVPLSKLNKGTKIDTDYKLLYKELHSLHEAQKKELKQERLDTERLKTQLGFVTDNYIDASNRLSNITPYEQKFKKLHNSLVGCLSHEEKEAASYTGCSEEVYAVELLKIFQEWKNHNKKPSDYGKNETKCTYRGY